MRHSASYRASMHNILRLLEYSAGVSAEWHRLAVTLTVASGVSLSDSSGSATRMGFYTGEKLSCACTITDGVCAAHPNFTVAVIEYRTVWALQVVLPCCLKMLFQRNRSFCKRLDTKVFGLT